MDISSGTPSIFFFWNFALLIFPCLSYSYPVPLYSPETESCQVPCSCFLLPFQGTSSSPTSLCLSVLQQVAPVPPQIWHASGQGNMLSVLRKVCKGLNTGFQEALSLPTGCLLPCRTVSILLVNSV